MDGHEGGIDPSEDPSETTAKSLSSECTSAEQRDLSKPSAAPTNKKSNPAAKGPDLDPTGHEGSYSPSTD